MDLSVVFSTNDTDDITTTIIPAILRNLMKLNSTLNIDGVNYPAAIDMIFERVERINGSIVSVDNVTPCMYIMYASRTRTLSGP